MRLSDYPKPVRDNGRGVHWIPYTWGQVTSEQRRVADELCAQLRAMNIRWVLILNGMDEAWPANEYLVRRLVGDDPAHPEIMPILRLGDRFEAQTLEKLARGEPVGMVRDRLREVIRFYRALGVSYFQLYNEPNHPDEWQDRVVPAEAAQIAAIVWLEAAREVLAAGGLPGLPPLTPGGRWPGGDDLDMLAQLLDEIDVRLTVSERDQLYDRMWVGIHNYTLNRPIYSLPPDSHAFKKYVWYQGIVRAKIGHELPLLTGEGGLRAGPPPYGDGASEGQVAERAREICRHMAFAPEYYFCHCFWLLGSAIGGGNEEWESAAWFRRDGSRQPVVDALQALDEYQRAPPPEEERFVYRNGFPMKESFLVREPFLSAWNALGGIDYCGYPTSREVAEGECVIQGFERLTLEKDASGAVRIRGQAPRQITLRVPTVQELLASAGLTPGEIGPTLVAVAEAYGSAAALVPGEYTVQIPGQDAWRNQDIINAFWIAGGRTDFALLARAGLRLSDLTQDRQALYTGESPTTLSGLTTAERERVMAALPPLGPRTVTFRIPDIYALLEAQHLTQAEIARALKELATRYGPPERLPPGTYMVSLPAEPVILRQGGYTNQEIINAFWVAGGRSWDLLNRAQLKLAYLATNRRAAYAGPEIDDLPNLTDQEQAWVRQALPPRRLAPLPTSSRAAALPGLIWQDVPAASFTPGRCGYALDLIVIHATGQSLRDTLHRARALNGISYHYVIDRDGTVYHLVRDEDTARHMTCEAPDQRRQTVAQPNCRALAVALVNWGLTPDDTGEMAWDPYTDEQYLALRRLLNLLCQTHRIPRAFPPQGPASYLPTEQLAHFRGILGHSALTATHSSPGPQFDWQRII